MARKLYNFPFLEVLFWSWSAELQFCKAEGSKCQSFVLNPQPLTFFITQMLLSSLLLTIFIGNFTKEIASSSKQQNKNINNNNVDIINLNASIFVFKC